MTNRQNLRDPSPDVQALRRHNIRLGDIRYIPIGQLKFYNRRIRRRLAKGLDALKASLAAFGFVLPILVDRDGVIVGGEGLLEAARALGIVEVPTLCVDHLDDGEVRLLRIALNKLSGTADWNNIELATEFTELRSMDIELDLTVTGFETVEIDNLMFAPADPEANDPDDEQEAVGALGSAISRLGDVWEAGEHCPDRQLIAVLPRDGGL